MKRREELGVSDDTNLCSFCYPSREEEIIYDDDNVYVMPALGQFVEGYVLMINKEHEECFAGVIDQERRSVKNRLKDVLIREYGSYCFFEHGRIGTCLNRAENRICYPAHLHCLPIPEDFTSAVEEEHKRIGIEDITEVAQLRRKYPHYFYLETFNGRKSFFIVEESVERQYMKKRACEALGIPVEHADYTEYPFHRKMTDTAESLKPRL